MSKANNLGDFLKDVADAIRTKTGDSSYIDPQDFSSRIAAIPVGGDNPIEVPDVSGVQNPNVGSFYRESSTDNYYLASTSSDDFQFTGKIADSGTINRMSYGNGYFVAIVNNVPYYSQDGEIWTANQGTIGVTGSAFNNIYSPGFGAWFAVSSSTTRLPCYCPLTPSGVWQTTGSSTIACPDIGYNGLLGEIVGVNTGGIYHGVNNLDTLGAGRSLNSLICSKDNTTGLMLVGQAAGNHVAMANGVWSFGTSITGLRVAAPGNEHIYAYVYENYYSDGNRWGFKDITTSAVTTAPTAVHQITGLKEAPQGQQPTSINFRAACVKGDSVYLAFNDGTIYRSDSTKLNFTAIPSEKQSDAANFTCMATDGNIVLVMDAIGNVYKEDTTSKVIFKKVNVTGTFKN